MTKQDLIHEALTMDFNTICDQLNKLCIEDRITTGAAYYVYDPYKSWGYQTISEIVNKAGSSKDYFRYIKRIKIRSYNYYLNNIKESLQKAKDFIEENTNCPFEQSQKQKLIASGELKETTK